ncbi:Uma2 family endonuclease [Thiocapsa sp.]|uniref:Uma2 family endonuclease n=1 Tax=Thiocapsa sp. TaxID=2024551 RepID=UPI002B6D07ED|nr:Uma2 family endonuclease [Thiocapsa sp.]HSO81121.1 Uma2 family endonuclease [Thiocapsa sp.]
MICLSLLLSAGFLLPNGAMRSPDLAWVLREQLDTMRPKQKRRFLPLVPDDLIALASPGDDSDGVHAKMREWRDNGVRLGWLILPEQRQVWRYTGTDEPACLDNPAQIGDDALLPGLVLPLMRIWDPGF